MTIPVGPGETVNIVRDLSLTVMLGAGIGGVPNPNNIGDQTNPSVEECLVLPAAPGPQALLTITGHPDGTLEYV